MEKLTDRAGREDLTETSKRLSKQLKQAEIMRLDALMLRTVAYYPNQEMSPETFTEFREAFKQMALLHGVGAVENAVIGTRLRSKFFPHPAEVNEIIEEQIDIERHERSRQWAEDRIAEDERKAKEEHDRIMADGGYVTMAEIFQAVEAKKKATVQ